MAHVALKIRVAKTGAVKTLPFDPNKSAGEVCREIRDRLGEGGSDHGLFYVGDDFNVGKWLENNKTLAFYELRSGDLVEFKKKHRPLRVQLVDGSIKTVLVDDSMVVSDMTAVICARVNIENAEEFSLKRVDSDDNIWLNPQLSLREQGLTDTDAVLLKQRFHYSDSNVDTTNPAQLNLLYEQCKEAILTGKYPCTQAEAIQFAALQCQVNLKDHNPSRHKSLDATMYFPQEYTKVKKLDKQVFSEHRKLVGMSEINAKYRYVQLCRSLKTYGVTFFLVKEQVKVSKGKKTAKKLVDILLGLTKEMIVRMDVASKQVLSSYPLAHLRRWAASTNSFTFDFGDYEEAYYSVQTSEGEAISQVISGYIDIILKKKKQAGRYVVDDDEEQTVMEEDLSAMKAQALSTTPGSMSYAKNVNLSRAGLVDAGGNKYGMGGSSAQHPGLSHPDSQNAASAWKGEFTRGSAGELESFNTANAAVLNAAGMGGLLKDLEGAFSAVNAACNELAIPVNKSPMGDDPMAQQWRQRAMQGTRQQLRTQANGMTVATAQVLGSAVCADADSFDPENLAAACKNLGNHMTQLATLARTAASLVDDEESAKLLGAANQLANSTKRLVAAANGAAGGLCQSIVDPKIRQEMLDNAKDIGKQVNQLLTSSGAGEVDVAGQNKLFEKTAGVAQAATKLVNEAKQAAQRAPGDGKADINDSAKNVWTNTSSLVAVVKVLAPTVTNAKSKQQLEKSAQHLKGAVGSVLDKAEAAGLGAADLGKLKQACKGVNDALQALIDQAKKAGEKPDYTRQYEKAAQMIHQATKALAENGGNPQRIVQAAKAVGQGSAAMVKFGKHEAQQETDPYLQKALLDATRRLADATGALVSAAKAAAAAPQDPAKQQALRAGARNLDIMAQDMLAGSKQRVAMRNLVNASQDAVAETAKLIQASKPAAANNRNQQASKNLIANAKQTAQQVTALVSAVKAHEANPNDKILQGKLINAAKSTCVPASRLVNSAKQASPHVTDPAAQANLGKAAKGCASTMQKLLTALRAAKELQGGLEFDTAIADIGKTKQALQATGAEAARGTLQPEFGETPQTTFENFVEGQQAVNKAMDQLLKSCQEKDDASAAAAAREVGSGMRGLGQAINGVAATTDDPNVPARLVDQGQELADRLIDVVTAAKTSAAQPDNAGVLDQLMNAVGDAKNVMGDMQQAMPGQREVEDALRAIQAESDFSSLPPLQANQSLKSFQDEFMNAARALAAATQALTNSVNQGPDELAKAARAMQQATERVLRAGKAVAGATRDPKLQGEIVDALGNLSNGTQELLSAAANAAGKPNDADAQQRLNDAAMLVGEALNDLQNLFQAAGPGQVECDAAMKAITQAAKAMTAGSTASPMAGKSYAELQKEIKKASKALIQGTSQIMKAAKTNPDKVGQNAKLIGQAVKNITQAASATAQLVGDGGQVTVNQFTTPAEDIKDACNALQLARGDPKKIIKGCTDIAKATQNIIGASKLASQQVDNPADSQKFMDLAKLIASTTAATVGAGKKVARDNSPGNNNELKAKSGELQAAVADVVRLAQAKLASSSASPQAKATQQKITQGAQGVATNSSQLLGAAKLTAVNPSDVKSQRGMAMAAKNLSGSIAQLLAAVSDAAPGAQECKAAIAVVQGAVADLDTAAMNASVDSLVPEQGQSLAECRAGVVDACKQLAKDAQVLSRAAASRPHELGPAAESIATTVPELSDNAIGLAACGHDPVRKQEGLGAAKAVAEAVADLLNVSKEAAGNAEPEQQMRLDQATKNVSDSLDALVSGMKGAIKGTQAINKAQDDIKKSLDLLDAPLDEGKDYRGYNDDLTNLSKDLAGAISNLVNSSKNDPSNTPAAAARVGEIVPQMMKAASGAAQTSNEPAKEAMIRDAAANLNRATAQLVNSSGKASLSPNDFGKQQAVSKSARQANMQNARLISALKQKSSAVKGCESAIESIQAAMQDVETTAMFASMGQLERKDGAEWAQHRGDMMGNAKSLAQGSAGIIKDAKTSAASLGQNAERAAANVNEIVAATKNAAGATFDKELQKRLFDACRAVCNATANLIEGARATSDNPSAPGVQDQLTRQGKEFADSVGNYVKTVKAVNQENTRGIAACKAANQAIQAEVPALDNASPPKVSSSVEEMVESSKAVAAASATLVSAARGAPAALEAAARQAQEHAVMLLQRGKAAAALPESDPEAKPIVHGACKATATAMGELLAVIEKSGGYTKSLAVGEQMAAATKKIAEAVSSVVDSAKELKKDYFDPNDPNAVAERELLMAAQSIEAAASKLAALEPRSELEGPNLDLAFEEQILEAAKAIAAATAALVKAATQAQREIIAKGKAMSADRMYHADPVWQQGLVSAAKSVAGSTNALCNAANDAAQGNASEDALIAAANGVAQNTAHLVAAARAKADKNSRTQERLGNAAKSVKSATKMLVDSARAAGEKRADAEAAGAMWNIDENSTAVQRMRAEQEARERVLKLERELERARAGVKSLHKGRYGGAAGAAPAAGPPSPARSAPKPKPKARGPKPSGGAYNVHRSDGVVKTLAELQGGCSDIDPSQKETYLSDAEFESVFGMNKDAFGALPKWKRDGLKRTNNLY